MAQPPAATKRDKRRLIKPRTSSGKKVAKIIAERAYHFDASWGFPLGSLQVRARSGWQQKKTARSGCLVWECFSEVLDCEDRRRRRQPEQPCTSQGETPPLPEGRGRPEEREGDVKLGLGVGALFPAFRSFSWRVDPQLSALSRGTSARRDSALQLGGGLDLVKVWPAGPHLTTFLLLPPKALLRPPCPAGPY